MKTISWQPWASPWWDIAKFTAALAAAPMPIRVTVLDHEYLAMLPLPFWTGGNGIAGPSARHPNLIRIAHAEDFPPNSPVYNPVLMLEGASAKAFAWALQALLDGAVQLSPDAQLVVPTLGEGPKANLLLPANIQNANQMALEFAGMSWAPVGQPKHDLSPVQVEQVLARRLALTVFLSFADTSRASKLVRTGMSSKDAKTLGLRLLKVVATKFGGALTPWRNSYPAGSTAGPMGKQDYHVLVADGSPQPWQAWSEAWEPGSLQDSLAVPKSPDFDGGWVYASTKSPPGIRVDWQACQQIWHRTDPNQQFLGWLWDSSPAVALRFMLEVIATYVDEADTNVANLEYAYTLTMRWLGRFKFGEVKNATDLVAKGPVGQGWFRGPRYPETVKINPAVGNFPLPVATLHDFLVHKIGYRPQLSQAVLVLARTLGVPAGLSYHRSLLLGVEFEQKFAQSEKNLDPPFQDNLPTAWPCWRVATYTAPGKYPVFASPAPLPPLPGNTHPEPGKNPAVLVGGTVILRLRTNIATLPGRWQHVIDAPELFAAAAGGSCIVPATMPTRVEFASAAEAASELFGLAKTTTTGFVNWTRAALPISTVTHVLSYANYLSKQFRSTAILSALVLGSYKLAYPKELKLTLYGPLCHERDREFVDWMILLRKWAIEQLVAAAHYGDLIAKNPGVAMVSTIPKNHAQGYVNSCADYFAPDNVAQVPFSEYKINLPGTWCYTIIDGLPHWLVGTPSLQLYSHAPGTPLMLAVWPAFHLLAQRVSDFWLSDCVPPHKETIDYFVALTTKYNS